MSTEMITLIIIIALLVLIFAGFPIAFSLLSIAIMGILVWVKPAALAALASLTMTSTTIDYYIALPMFIFMAAVLEDTSLGSQMYDTMYKWMAGLKGGLAMGTVVISTVIAAMSGVAATSVVTMGILAYPEMMKRGYDKKLSIGCIAAGGCLGPLIPPSVPMIYVASFCFVSIGRLFMAGVFPGLLVALFFCIYIAIRCFLNPRFGPPIPADSRADWKERFISLRGVILPIMLIIAVLGGIYTGICTPSEAGGVGAFGALICAAVYRNLNWKTLKTAVRTSLRVNAMIFWIILGGSCFSAMLGLTGVKETVKNLLLGLSLNPMLVITLMLTIVFILGMFIDATAIAMICLPIFVPIVQALGFDMIWFALIFIMGMLVGYITPPFGVNLFYFMGLGHEGVAMTDIFRAVLPYVVVLMMAWLVCIIYPPLTTWLPAQMIK
ncbi:MAG: TRAP transporter large permease subunit [Dehalococcoidales bacterium]|nr:TRAP transporter large permease subunit [Dehalococcoidales bacterium]